MNYATDETPLHRGDSKTATHRSTILRIRQAGERQRADSYPLEIRKEYGGRLSGLLNPIMTQSEVNPSELRGLFRLGGIGL